MPQQFRVNVALGRPLAAGVKRLSCVLLAPVVHQGIAGAAVKTAHRIGSLAARFARSCVIFCANLGWDQTHV